MRNALERSGDVTAVAVRAWRSAASALALVLTIGSTGHAQTPSSFLDRPAHIRVYNVPLLDALRDLEQRGGVALAYSPSLLPSGLRVTCACDNLTIRDALRILLVNTQFNFRESDNQILLYPVGQDIASKLKAAATDYANATQQNVLDALGVGTTKARADSTTITGLVTTDVGAPIASALVTLPGLHRSTVTGENGIYRFVIPSVTLATRAETLRVARLGFKPIDRGFSIASNKVEIDVAMTTQVVALDQVLVTGTAGNQERGAQAAVIGTIDAADVMSKAPAQDVNQLMYGRMSGVSMTTASGTSGANTRIDIRGQASVSLSNYPLVFVDGVRILAGPRIVTQAPGGTTFGAGGQQFNALNDLNPNDIESIEIVKGPAAATLYGADASAGVIQILTRKGRAGSRRFNQHISSEYDNIDPAFTPYTNYAKCTAALVAVTSPNPLCRGRADGTVISDNVLERNGAFSDGAAGSINYSAQGGADNVGYFGSFSASNERGTSRQSFLNHRTGRMSASLIASPKLTIDGAVGFVRSDDRLPQGDQSAYGYLLGGALGSPLTVTNAANGPLTGGWFNNNLSVRAIGAILTEDNTLRATPSMQMRYAPVSWFTNRLTIGADVARTTLSQMFPRNDSSWYTSIANTGSITVTDANTTIYTVDYLGNINHRFGRTGDVSTDLSFGSQWINTLNTSVGGSGQGLLTNSNNLLSAATTTAAIEAYGQTKSLGFLGQGQVGFRDRLFLQLGARVDRNSAFGSSVGSFFLPKAGASWVISQEPFWQPISDVIPTLRLRTAYGTTGRSPSALASLQTYSRANYLTDLGAVLPGVSPGSPGNPNIKPERGSELEVGIDAGFFHDRAGVEITYFNKTSKDLLLTQPIAPSSGFASSPLVNVGEVVNKGLEISLRATPIDARNVNLDATLNLNTLHNEITSMGDITPFVNSNNQCFKPGVEVAAWCVPRVLSVDTIAHRSIVSDTAQVAGGQLPKLAASFVSTLTLFRNLKISTQVDGKFDYSVYNLTRDLRDRTVQPPNSADVNLPADQGGYSTYERQRRLGPFYAQNSGASVGAALVRGPYIVPGDFVRLRELAVTFTIPSDWSRRLGIETSSLSLGGRNLALWTRYDGWDPEVIGVIDPATPFLGDVFTTPQSRRAFARLSVSY